MGSMIYKSMRNRPRYLGLIIIPSSEMCQKVSHKTNDTMETQQTDHGCPPLSPYINPAAEETEVVMTTMSLLQLFHGGPTITVGMTFVHFGQVDFLLADFRHTRGHWEARD